MSINKKVALVTPPITQKVAHHPLYPPLGLAYMAAVLEQNSFEVKIIDSPVLGFNHQQIKAELEAYQPAIVGVGSMTPTFESAIECARVAKEAVPDAQVIMGGPHATFADSEVLAAEKAVDVIVRGEGEETIVELAKQRKLGDVKGISFRKNGEIIRTAQRPYIQNLDALPRPAYHLLPMKKYNITGRNLLPIISSRGCPFQCPFCVASQMFGQQFRARSPKNVLDELEWLRDEYGAEGITFQDDTLTFDKKRTLDICNGMIERKIGLHWGCGTRADVVTKEVMAKMKQAHCDETMFGVEAGCQRMRDVLKKRVSTEQIENAIKWTKEVGIFVTVSVILGYPGETAETLQESLDFVRKVEPDEVWLCHATPYPGTCLREIVKQNGWQMSDKWELYNTMNPIFEDPNLPASKIADMRRDFYNKFYSPKYILRQTAKGYFRGNLYSKIMARTAVNYMLWRLMSHR
ncbi:MAG: radical SAM protein [Candidatus Bathyarchaeota archaeon]|nr:radical SAM protein [Candidatus Bathyarchaeota archaeon]